VGLAGRGTRKYSDLKGLPRYINASAPHGRTHRVPNPASDPPAEPPVAPKNSELEVTPFQGDAASWDALLTDPEATFCHRYGWKAVFEETLGHETFWLVARDESEQPQGVLPLTRVKSRLFGDYLVSMPFLNYGGPVGTPTAQRALATEAQNIGQKLGVDLLELRTRHVTDDSDLSVNARKLTVVKQLPSDPKELWEKGIKAKVRSQIRRPMKEGMDIRFGPEQLDAFYDIFSTTMRDLGTPVLPLRFFEVIRSEFGSDVIFTAVYLGDEPVAAACGLGWSDEFEITWAGSSREHARKAPNMLLYWGLMEECVRRGFATFNFGRCSPDSGTHRFKKQWGGDDVPLPWLQWSPSDVVATPNPDSAKFRMATRAWQRLPVGVANMIGPRISRSLP